MAVAQWASQPSVMDVVFSQKKWTSLHIWTVVWQLSVRIAVSRGCTFQVLIAVKLLSRKVSIFKLKSALLKCNLCTIKCTFEGYIVKGFDKHIYLCNHHCNQDLTLLLSKFFCDPLQQFPLNYPSNFSCSRIS